jgi:hypothetical protein
LLRHLFRSVGVLLWELFSGCQPWKGYTAVQILKHVGMKRCSLPLTDDVGLPLPLRALLADLWHAEPAKRPTAKEALNRLRAWRSEEEAAAKLAVHTRTLETTS